MEKQVRVGIGVIISNSAGEMLLGKRKGSHSSGTWSFPGGHLEYGETFEECAEREVFEETGLRISNIKLFTITNDIFTKEDKHYVTIYLTAEVESGIVEVKEPHKCSKWDWFNIWNLPKNLFLPVQNLIKTKILLEKSKNFD